ncbi:MAG: hypothetical protein AB1649_11180 [Chloroflexota bacterium]
MTRIDLTPASLTSRAASPRDPAADRRLIVLVPAETDSTALAPRIWELANALESRVQFLGLSSDAAQESSLRRQLVTMSAMVEDGKVHSEAWLVIGKDWVSAVRLDLREGDMLVCFEGQHAGFFHKPLSQILESNLRTPVYVLSGLFGQPRARLGWPSQIAAWIGSLGIIAGAALLQIQIASLPRDWAQTTFMILSVILEAWLVWAWNGLFG